MDEEGFQACSDKRIDGLLDPAPDRAFVFQYHPADGKTAVHLKPENCRRLLKGQVAFLLPVLTAQENIIMPLLLDRQQRVVIARALIAKPKNEGAIYLNL